MTSEAAVETPQKRYARKHPDRLREAARRYAQKYPERAREAQKRYNAKHPDRVRRRQRDHQLKRHYGMSVEQFEELLAKQGHKCAVCERDNSKDDAVGKRRWHVDHCHKTKNVRGVLCPACNMALGLLKDDTRVLQKAISYLESYDDAR